jgi:hypothetical protein
MSFLLTEEIKGQVENLPKLCMQEKHMIFREEWGGDGVGGRRMDYVKTQ